jgi:hypothetical protein
MILTSCLLLREVAGDRNSVLFARPGKLFSPLLTKKLKRRAAPRMPVISTSLDSIIPEKKIEPIPCMVSPHVYVT